MKAIKFGLGKIKRGAAIFACGLFLAAAVFAQKSEFTVSNGGGTFYVVSGNVQANGANLEGATVILIFNGSVTEAVTTDANGNYSLNAIENFTYTISVYKEGFNFNPTFQVLNNIQSNRTINFQNGVRLCIPAPFGQTGENYCQTAVVTPVSEIENGRIAYEVFGTTFAVNEDGTNQAQLPPGGAFLSWSPDGTRLLYNRDPSTDIGFDQEIFLMNADGSTNRQVTSNAWSEYRASWSPDGKRIIFERLVNSSDIGIYTMNVDGTNETRLTAPDVIATDASFSPDGTKIVYTVGTEIFVMNADGTNPTQLTSSGEFFQSIEPSWSPDGLHIVFASNRLGFGNEIWRMTATGDSLVKLTSEADLEHRTPVYSPDGTKIAFSRQISVDNSYREIYSKPLFGGASQRLTVTFQQSNAESPSWQSVLGDVGVALSSGVNLTFSNVTNAGNTVATPIAPESAGALPPDFRLIPESVAFDVRTSASFAGENEICFDLPNITDENLFNSLVIFHNENGELVDRTTSRDFAARRLCATISSFSPFVVAAPIAPTAANVSVAGQVFTKNGNAIANAEVRLTDSSGAVRSVRTSAFGVFRFEAVESGQTYVFEVRSGRYHFTPQILNVTEEIQELNFFAER